MKNIFGDSACAHHGTGSQINAAGGTVNNTVYHGIDEAPIQVRDCWRSLAFQEMDNRLNDIDAAQTGTCEWLSRHKMYRNWAKKNRGLLWIKGKPGSGKSTLLRYALKKAAGRPGAGDKPLILSFFFHGRGTELQKTPLGFYRSLLYQLREMPDTLSDVIDTFRQRCETVGKVGERWQWHPKELRDFFESSLLKALKTRPLYLLVDALDECGEEEATILAQRFKSLLDSLRSPDFRPFRICFTCRSYPILALESVFQICVEEENETDISSFVQDKLSWISPKVSDLITKRASGVFLWASLMVNQVTRLKLEGETLEGIKAAILLVPQELDDLYCELIEGMEPDSLKLIRWICFAMRPLLIGELRWAMLIQADRPYSSLQEYQNSPDYQPDDESMKRKIQTLSHGLVEVTSGATVQFIHQTVKDFFVEKGLLMLRRPDSVPLRASQSDFAVRMAHHELSKICVRYLAMKEIVQSKTRGPENLMYDFPLLRYAMEMWAAHVNQSEQRGIPQDDILDCFPWWSQAVIEMWARLYRIFCDPNLRYREGGGYYEVKNFQEGTNLFHVVSAYNLTGLFQAMLRRTNRTESMINEKDKRGQTPLIWAVKSGHEAMSRLLLDNGANVDSKNYAYGQTPLSYAAASGYKRIVQLLFNYGADIHAKDNSGQTPLFYATESGCEGIVRLLRKYGIDINMRNDLGQTPLVYAVHEGHNTNMQLLLEYGADVNTRDNSGQTPLVYAAYEGHDITMQLLLKHGADVDARDNLGQTPLLYAVTNGHRSTAQLLLEHGADANARDNSGWTPLLHSGLKVDMMRLLRDHGANPWFYGDEQF